MTNGVESLDWQTLKSIIRALHKGELQWQPAQEGETQGLFTCHLGSLTTEQRDLIASPKAHALFREHGLNIEKARRGFISFRDPLEAVKAAFNTELGETYGPFKYKIMVEKSPAQTEARKMRDQWEGEAAIAHIQHWYTEEDEVNAFVASRKEGHALCAALSKLGLPASCNPTLVVPEEEPEARFAVSFSADKLEKFLAAIGADKIRKGENVTWIARRFNEDTVAQDAPEKDPSITGWLRKKYAQFNWDEHHLVEDPKKVDASHLTYGMFPGLTEQVIAHVDIERRAEVIFKSFLRFAHLTPEAFRDKTNTLLQDKIGEKEFQQMITGRKLIPDPVYDAMGKAMNLHPDDQKYLKTQVTAAHHELIVYQKRQKAIKGMPLATIHTDAAFSYNAKWSGWAYKIAIEGEEQLQKGAMACKDNNDAEIRAVLESLKTLITPHNITLYTDSEAAANFFRGSPRANEARYEEYRRELGEILSGVHHHLNIVHRFAETSPEGIEVDNASKDALAEALKSVPAHASTPKQARQVTDEAKAILAAPERKWHRASYHPLIIRTFCSNGEDAKKVTEALGKATGHDAVSDVTRRQPQDYEGKAIRLVSVAFDTEEELKSFLFESGISLQPEAKLVFNQGGGKSRGRG